MNTTISISEYSITEDTAFYDDPYNESKSFPVCTIGRDSYVGRVDMRTSHDDSRIYNFQIGRYTSIASGNIYLIDMNHDYKRVCQGRISGITYRRPENIKRKGQIIIMNDCWIGQEVTILSGVTIGNGAVVAAGAVVSRDVPPYSIVAGNPAKVIGYRFNESQIQALQLIRWWNWSSDKVLLHANELYGDIDLFIQKHLEEAKKDLSHIPVIDIKPIEKSSNGEEKIFLYIPDFEQQYPTYPYVIASFVNEYKDTNHELLLYIKEDELLPQKLDVLDNLFAAYEGINCYINLYIGNLSDERSLFGQVDAYITNRSVDNVSHMDMADLFGIPSISSVDIPIFAKRQSMLKAGKHEYDSIYKNVQDTYVTKEAFSVVKDGLLDGMRKLYKQVENVSNVQFVLDKSLDNSGYELLDPRKNFPLPKVRPAEEAIDKIINEHKSICRFGDGEFAVIFGYDRQKFQLVNNELGLRLKEVLASRRDDVLICIADNYGDLSRYNQQGKFSIRTYMTEQMRREHYNILDMDYNYYDAYLSRPYVIMADNNTDAPRLRFEKLKQIWAGRELVIVEGAKTKMGVNNDLFAGAESICRILGPCENAYDRYKDLLSEVLRQDKSKLIIIALGASATVMAYDLACAGYQALDIGHIDLEYEWMLAGQGKRIPVKGKYNNELEGGDIVEDIYNEEYEKQIVARIY